VPARDEKSRRHLRRQVSNAEMFKLDELILEWVWKSLRVK
jgi:hypothetical protein